MASLPLDKSAFPLSARLARGVRRLFGLDRESRWNKAYAEGRWEWLRKLDELAHHAVLAGYAARLKPDGSVLDVGCGEGVFQEQLRGACSRYLGFDFDEPIRRAQHKVTGTTQFVVADMNEFATSDRFDVIVFNESLYYLGGKSAGLQRYEQFLNPGGVLLVSMYSSERSDAIWEFVDARYTVLDVVTITNRAGTRWTVKALVPPEATVGE